MSGLQFPEKVGNAIYDYVVKQVTDPENIIRAGSAAIDMLGKRNASTTITNAENKKIKVEVSRRFSDKTSPFYSNGSGIVPSMFQPGRGGELPFVDMNFSKPIKYRMDLGKGPVLKDASDAMALHCDKPCHVSHDFAYRVVFSSQQVVDNAYPNTRFMCQNVFRHAYAPIGSINNVSTNWHRTLGPDNSGTRLSPPSGTLKGGVFVPAGMSTNLLSPYRTPDNLDWMFCRLPLQALENIGWNANPLKLRTIQYEADQTPGVDQVLAMNQLTVYKNAELSQYVGTGNIWRDTPDFSLPGQQPLPATNGNGFSGTSYLYKSQNGYGKIDYTFNNDGTAPIVIDIVINRIKKGQTTPVLQNYVAGGDGLDVIQELYGQGYINKSLANRGVVNLQGDAPLASDAWADAKKEFLPAGCLRAGGKFSDEDHIGTSDPNPIKQVGRDQFIIPAGASRSWTTTLPKMSYYAPDYDTTSQADGSVRGLLDDRCFIFSLGFSTLPVPMVERSGTNTAVIDRRSTSVNCSVTGSYSEVAHPAFIHKDETHFQIYGALEEPVYFGSAGPALASVNIAYAVQTTRSAAADSALIEVRAVNQFQFA